MDKNKAIEILKELRDLSEQFEEIEIKELDAEALFYAIRILENNQ